MVKHVRTRTRFAMLSTTFIALRGYRGKKIDNKYETTLSEVSNNLILTPMMNLQCAQENAREKCFTFPPNITFHYIYYFLSPSPSYRFCPSCLLFYCSHNQYLIYLSGLIDSQKKMSLNLFLLLICYLASIHFHIIFYALP